MREMYLRNDTLLQGGKYKIVRFISSGGFGCTYEAEHVMLQTQMAIKEFFVKDFCNRDETTAHITVGTQSNKGLVDKLRGKFIDEAKAISHMRHPNIVRVSDVFEENGTAYYVMDYIDGQSLGDILKQEDSLPEPRALKYIRQVAGALRYVHEHNRLHLDVKPSNIMINDRDNAVLIDFGASKQYDEEEGENTSTLMGKTPGYAPLEQMGNDVVKFLPATDIYALGATLYKMLTGVTPPGANLLASGEELGALPAGTSKSTSAAISAAMQINKGKRPQSMAAFLSILDGTENGEETIIDEGARAPENPVEVRVPQPHKVTQPKKSKEKRNRSMVNIISIFAVCVVAIVVIIGVLALNWIKTPTKTTTKKTVAVEATIEEPKAVDIDTEESAPDETAIEEPKTVETTIEEPKPINIEAPNNGYGNLNEQDVNGKVIEEKSLKPKEDEVFRAVDQMPQFPGGEAALMEWIATHIQYPIEAAEEGAQGKVTIQFVVTKDGSIGQVIVARGRHPALDKEAVRVVKSLPKFIPGKMNGQAVNVWYTLPINFSLE